MSTLEQMVDKEKRRNYQLEGVNFDKEMVARQTPGELSKRYEVEI
jgi:hypothetical protein